jgi:hypothetical protein
VCAEDVLAMISFWISNYHRLAAAKIETSDRALVSHPTREAEDIHESFFVAVVTPQARSAKRGAERCIVNCDDSTVAAGRITAQNHLLVTHVSEAIEEVDRPVRKLHTALVL